MNKWAIYTLLERFLRTKSFLSKKLIATNEKKVFYPVVKHCGFHDIESAGS